MNYQLYIMNRLSGNLIQKAIYPSLRLDEFQTLIYCNIIYINSCDGYQKTLLMYLCERNPKLEFIKTLVEAGADVDHTDKYRRNCLFYLLLNGNFNPKVAEYLISKGCSLEYGAGPIILHCMIINRKLITKEKLDIIKKCNPDILNQKHDGLTPLMRIFSNYSEDLSLVDMLIDAGADINILDDNLNTCFHYSMRKYGFVVDSLMLYFLSKGINLNQKNSEGSSILNIYSKSRFISFDILKRLITPENINWKDKTGKTPLLSYIMNGKDLKLKDIKFFIDKGADPTIKDNDGIDCLYYLFSRNKIGIKSVELLIKSGCNIDQVSIHGSTILHEIANYPTDEKLKIFQKFSKEFKNEYKGNTPLIFLSKNNFYTEVLKMIRKFIEYGYKVNEEEKEVCLFNEILMHHDISIKTEEEINHLLEKGFKIKFEHEGRNILDYENDMKIIMPFTNRKLIFLANQNLPLGKINSIYRKELEYFGIKSTTSNSYQLYY